MAVAWRSTCLILLLVANFQMATVVQAQTDYSFERWLGARDRSAKGLAAEMQIPFEAAIDRIRCGREESRFGEIICKSILRRDPPNSGRCGDKDICERDRADYERDRAGAVERGISFDEVFAEREARTRLAEPFVKRESRTRLAEAKFAKERAEAIKRERAEAIKRQAVQLGVAATIVIAVIVIVFRARRRIAASFSSKWRGRSEAFRAWAFGSFSWAVGMFLFVWLFNPDYTDGWSDYLPEFLHLLGVMIVPPLFFGAVWFGYKRFVK